jgi:DNA polymerase-3 subunit gamma/tau
VPAPAAPPAPSAAAAGNGAPPAAPAAEAGPGQAPVAVADPGALDLATVAELWPAVLETISSDSHLLAHVLRSARPIGVDGGTVTLGFPEIFLKRKAEDPSNREALAVALRSITGMPLRPAFELCSSEDVAAPGAAVLSEDELLARFMAEFDAEELPPEEEKS